MPTPARKDPARAGLNSVGSASSSTTRTLSLSNCAATAWEMATTTVAKRRVRTRSTRRASDDWTTISRACHT